ncbi:MAG: TolC family protein [Acidobacteriota bacterium]
MVACLSDPVSARAQETSHSQVDLTSAINITFENDPQIERSRQQLEIARGGLEIAASAFEPLLSASGSWIDSRLATGPDSADESEVLGFGLGLDRLLRGGTLLQPRFDIERDPGTVADATVNVGTLSLALTQPLLRGRGRTATAADERASRLDVAAAERDLHQLIEGRVRSVARQYWRTVAAQDRLAILQATEDSSRQLLATTRLLVDADQTPRADLVLIEADLTAKEIDRIAAESALFAARQDLGREMGLDAQALQALAPPSDALPTITASADLPTLPAAQRFVDLATERRHDLAALRLRREATTALRTAARSGLLPALDLTFVPSYSGAIEGSSVDDFFSSTVRNSPGLSSELRLQLGLPLRNRAAEGRWLQATARDRTSELLVEELLKGLAADVPTAVDAVERSRQQVRLAAASVRLFEKAVANEEKKLRAEASTLIDVITQRDRLTAARQRMITARLAYAQALIDLRFQTATLTAVADPYRLGDLETVPDPRGGAP